MAEVARLPASVAQRLLWVLEQYRGAKGSVNCPILLRLRGPLDLGVLDDGLTALTARHDSLRTTLTGRGSGLEQVVHEPRPVRPRLVDLGVDQDREGALREAVATEVARTVDIADWPSRTTLFRLGPRDHALLLNLHHGATDGWSCGLIVRDLEALTSGSTPSPPVWQYPRFCEWQQEWLEGEGPAAERRYWTEHLEGSVLPRIPLGPVPTEGPKWESASVTGVIPAATMTALGRLARAQRATVASALLAVHHLALRELTGDEDLVVATFLANRTLPQMRDTVGLLANMAVLRTRLAGSEDVGEVIRRTHATAMEGFVHQRLPFQLMRAGLLDAPGRRPDDVMFQLVPPMPSPLRVAGTDARIEIVDQLGSRFECEFQCYPHEGMMRIVLCYNRIRLDGAFARRLVDRYVELAGEVARGA